MVSRAVPRPDLYFRAMPSRPSYRSRRDGGPLSPGVDAAEPFAPLRPALPPFCEPSSIAAGVATDSIHACTPSANSAGVRVW